MTMIYDKTARKKATNLTINSDLLRKAKELKINLSSSFEKNLEQVVRDEKNKRWQKENKDFIDEYNARIERDGLFSDDHRCF